MHARSATLKPSPRYLNMEHMGVQYELLQNVSPPGWKWVVRLGATKTSGFSRSKDVAVLAAQRAIEKALRGAEEEDGRES
jgi:hypothetical protein